jgi:hypothetical protein
MASTGSTSCSSNNCYGGCRFLDGYYGLSQVTGAPSGGGSDTGTCDGAPEAAVPGDLAGYGCSRGLTYGGGSVWACRADLYRPSASYDVVDHAPQSSCVGPPNPGYVLVRTHCPDSDSKLRPLDNSCPIGVRIGAVAPDNMGCSGPCLL